MSGFQHGKRYRIRSVFDGSLIDLHNASTTDGNMIKTYQPNGSDAQKWVCDMEANGFRLGTPINAGVLKVLDLAVGSMRVNIWGFHGGSNQIWRTEHVGGDKYLIKSACNGRAIRNNGRDQPLICVAADSGDISQQWNLLPV